MKRLHLFRRAVHAVSAICNPVVTCVAVSGSAMTFGDNTAARRTFLGMAHAGVAAWSAIENPARASRAITPFGILAALDAHTHGVQRDVLNAALTSAMWAVTDAALTSTGDVGAFRLPELREAFDGIDEDAAMEDVLRGVGPTRH
jgi:hypothetical protein